MAKSKGKIIRYRSAVNGRFVKKKYAEKNPKKTIRDEMKRTPPNK